MLLVAGGGGAQADQQGAWAELLTRPYGQPMVEVLVLTGGLAIVAVGLVLFGVHSSVDARCRRVCARRASAEGGWRAVSRAAARH